MTVELVPYDPGWQRRFLLEQLRLHGALPGTKFEHIGSTSIPGLSAKPVIDMLAGVTDASLLPEYAAVLTTQGYVQEGSRPETQHAWFCRPSPEAREYILHLVPAGGREWTNRLAFRDHLRSHPEIARSYEVLKRRLAAAHADDLDAYTEGKAMFVHRVVSVALTSG